MMIRDRCERSEGGMCVRLVESVKPLDALMVWRQGRRAAGRLGYVP